MEDGTQSAEVMKTIEAYDVPDSIKALMGDIITLSAEIDYLISLALYQVAEIDPVRGIMLFGPLSIGKRIDHLVRILKHEGPEELKTAFVKNTKPALENFLRARNTIAHGVIVGRIDDSICFFITSSVATFDEEAVIFTMRRLFIDGFKNCKAEGQLLVRQIREIFSVAPLMETVEYTILKQRPTTRK